MHDRSRLQPPEICNSLRNSLWGRPAIGGNLASAIVRRLLRPGVSEPPTAGVLDVDPPRPGEGVERSHAPSTASARATTASVSGSELLVIGTRPRCGGYAEKMRLGRTVREWRAARADRPRAARRESGWQPSIRFAKAKNAKELAARQCDPSRGEIKSALNSLSCRASGARRPYPRASPVPPI